ncbi:MAG: hypothetical protein NTY30_02445 [Candidatus Berkelbacteria bacterium]|nr:hypothetical protein [Candidatus Berkelbacteria bacterium]
MWILTIISAIFVAFLSSTLTPSFAINVGTLDLNLIIVLIFLFYGSFRQACIFLLISSIVLSVLSGTLLVYLLLPMFLLVLLYLFFSARRIVVRPSTISSLLIFFIASIFVGMLKMLVMQHWSFSLAIPLISSSVYNAIVGGVIYHFCNKIYYFLNPQLLREKVKIGRF